MGKMDSYGNLFLHLKGSLLICNLKLKSLERISILSVFYPRGDGLWQSRGMSVWAARWPEPS